MARTKPEIKKFSTYTNSMGMPIDPANVSGTPENLKRKREQAKMQIPAPPKQGKLWVRVLLTIVQWLIIAAVLFFVLFGFHFKLQLPITRPMDGWLVILSGVSFAFVWVDVLKWGVSRPWNCVTCLSGWFSLLFAIVFHTHFWYLYLGIGCFTGHLFTIIRMRWL